MFGKVLITYAAQNRYKDHALKYLYTVIFLHILLFWFNSIILRLNEFQCVVVVASSKQQQTINYCQVMSCHAITMS